MSLSSKINEFMRSAAGQKKLKETVDGYIQRGVSKTEGGSKLVTQDTVMMLASKLRELIIRHAATNDIPQSVMSNIQSLACTAPHKAHGGAAYQIDLFFTDDHHRDSLYEEGYPDGLSNIIALFNNGYLASDFVYGWWDNHSPTGESVFRSGVGTGSAFIRSKIARPGLQFLQDAVREFNTTVGADYDVTVKLDSIYEEVPTIGK